VGLTIRQGTTTSTDLSRKATSSTKSVFAVVVRSKWLPKSVERKRTLNERSDLRKSVSRVR
jgi:hypothetical protein